MIRLSINGKNVDLPEGTTVLRAAERIGITIPTLCDHPNLQPYGGCRLCLVEVEGFRTPMAACTLAASSGMVVQTESDTLTKARRAILELLLASYHDAGYANGQKGETQLLHWVQHYGIDLASVTAKTPRYALDSDPNPFIWVDMNKCILCARCIRACAQVQGRFVWGLVERGHQSRVMAGADTNMLAARCESCGTCVAYCPTGALDNKMSMGMGEPDRLVTTTCPYCGVGCQLDLNVKDGQIIRVTSNPKAAVNGLHLCVKGRYGYDFVNHPERLTKPRVRKYLLNNEPRQDDRGEWADVRIPILSAP